MDNTDAFESDNDRSNSAKRAPAKKARSDVREHQDGEKPPAKNQAITSLGNTEGFESDNCDTNKTNNDPDYLPDGQSDSDSDNSE